MHTLYNIYILSVKCCDRGATKEVCRLLQDSSVPSRLSFFFKFFFLFFSDFLQDSGDSFCYLLKLFHCDNDDDDDNHDDDGDNDYEEGFQLLEDSLG